MQYSERDFTDYLRYLKQDDVFDKNFVHRIKKQAEIKNVYDDLIKAAKQGNNSLTDRNKNQKLVSNI